jgi:hypothetical protein
MSKEMEEAEKRIGFSFVFGKIEEKRTREMQSAVWDVLFSLCEFQILFLF